MKPTISIIIPTYNEEKTIGKLLDSLLKLKYPKNKLEIIVVDDGSTDNTVEIVKKYPVELMRGRHKGPGVSRNVGWKRAGGELIIFLDADMVVDQYYVREMVKCLIDKEVVGCDHHEVLLNPKKLIARLLYLRKVLAWKNEPFVVRCVKREVLKRVGGIKPLYGYFDDQMLGIKIWKRGYRIIRCKKAKVWHKEPENLKEIWRQSKWIGKSIIFILRKDKKLGIRKSLFPLLCGCFPLYVLFLLFHPILKLLGIIGILIFLTIETYRSLKMYKITKWEVSFLTPFFDIATMFFVCIGMLIGILKKEQPKV
jgi:glycosyltransferase involved in cell wall biosynthesis